MDAVIQGSTDVDFGTILVELISLGWVLFYWITSGVSAGYLVTLVIQGCCHWKYQSDFRSLGEGYALFPFLPTVFLVSWLFYMFAAWSDTMTLIENRDFLSMDMAIAFSILGALLGWALAYERLSKPIQKVRKINQLPPCYKTAIGWQDLSITFDCLWRTGKFAHLWEGFYSAPSYKVCPAWSKYYRELAAYYPRRVIRWGSVFQIIISTSAVLVAIIALLIGS